jgi:hypothetical protein
MPQPKKLSTGTGRILEDWPPVPVPAKYRVEGVLDWVYEHRNRRRTAETLGWLLTVVCMLEEKGHYLPSRRRLANALAEWKGETVKDPSARKGSPDSSNPIPHRAKYIDSIDSAINSALAEGEIEEEYRITEGAHAKRLGVVRHRYLHPTRELLMAYQRLDRAAAKPRLVASR